MRRAKMYLAGAGPGDRELLTVKGLRILQRADVVSYDRLVRADVSPLLEPDAPEPSSVFHLASANRFLWSRLGFGFAGTSTISVRTYGRGLVSSVGEAYA